VLLSSAKNPRQSNENKNEVMASTVLNEAQLELLRMVSVFNTPEAVTDLKQAISNYFAQKTEEEIDRLWENGTLTKAKVESFRSLHERTAVLLLPMQNI
jgi:predicted 3-demethylubiquinone-9 3-methyltransferase (glyoxalase superfamily)